MGSTIVEPTIAQHANMMHDTKHGNLMNSIARSIHKYKVYHKSMYQMEGTQTDRVSYKTLGPEHDVSYGWVTTESMYGQINNNMQCIINKQTTCNRSCSDQPNQMETQFLLYVKHFIMHIKRHKSKYPPPIKWSNPGIKIPVEIRSRIRVLRY